MSIETQDTQEVTQILHEETTPTATHTEIADSHVDPGLLGKFGINGVGFVGQLVNFLIILAVLKFLVFPRVIKMMDERTRRIEQGMHDAEEAGKRLASMEEERKALMVEAKAETRKMFEAAHTQSEADARDLIEKAKREVERIIVTSKTQLKTEQETMLRDARKEMAELVITATTKILASTIDEKKARSLAEETLRKLT